MLQDQPTIRITYNDDELDEKAIMALDPGDTFCALYMATLNRYSAVTRKQDLKVEQEYPTGNRDSFAQ